MVKAVMSKEDFKDYITKGKIYKVLGTPFTYYEIIDNSDNQISLYRFRFTEINCEMCTSRQCNECVLNKK